MARMRAEVREELLAQPIIAVLSTIRRDGRPYLAPVWFLWQDGVFWLTGTSARTWCKHIFRDRRVSLCIETTDPIARYIAVDCEAEPVEQDIWPVSGALAQKYIGGRPGATPETVEQFIAGMQTEPRLLFRLTPTLPPERWRAIDLTVYTGVRGDRVKGTGNREQRTAGRGSGS